jgi:hypothetical protein
MPVGNVLVGNPRRNVKHDNTALALDIITIAKTTELFLSSSVPYVKADGAKVGSESQRMDFNTEGGWLRSAI